MRNMSVDLILRKRHGRNIGNDRLGDYTDIEGLLNEQSLILDRDNNIDINGRKKIEINENLLSFEP